MQADIGRVKEVVKRQRVEEEMQKLVQIAELVIALGAGVSVTSAQAETRPARLPIIQVVGNETADRLRQQAVALYDKPTQLRRAALLHEREAAQRNPADPQLVEALDRAARLHSYKGDHARGRELMQKAARYALERGDVTRAAHAYVDAAFIALRDRDVASSKVLVERAERLASSPLLERAQKDAIARRVYGSALAAAR